MCCAITENQYIVSSTHFQHDSRRTHTTLGTQLTQNSQTSNMDCDLDACFTLIVDIAKEAGEVIREAFYSEKLVQTKSNAADLVTETDQKVEKFIISSIKDKFPKHSFIGEESVAAGIKCHHTDNPTWIIDPIDGTTNFVHGFPYTCISVGLTVNKEVEIGLVYNPILKDMYTARRGQGAFLNGKPIHVTKTEELDKALICTEFGSERTPELLLRKSEGMRNVIAKAHGIRSLGSCAMNMAIVAAGSADGYYEHGIHCWDMAAGILLVREAGGVVYDTLGGPVDLLARRILCAGTETLANQLVACMVHMEYERD